MNYLGNLVGFRSKRGSRPDPKEKVSKNKPKLDKLIDKPSVINYNTERIVTRPSGIITGKL
jgi:hypothetical protein